MKPSLRERARYPSCHFDHGPKWVTHSVDGDDWFGFESVRVLPGVDPEILLIPLPGHSRGHSAVAVRDGEGGSCTVATPTSTVTRWRRRRAARRG